MSDGQPAKQNTQRLETLAIHAGYSVEPTTKAVAVPIYHTSSYAFDNTQHGADLFDLKVAGNIYTRIMNPTTAVLEERVAALEGGIGALAVASGMAAITYAIQTICEAGDNIVAVSTLYGGTYNLFAHALPRQGIEVRFFDHKNPEAIRGLIDDKTKMVFAESIGNPLGNIVDIQALSDIAHEYGVPVVIDSTVATPALCRPFEFGADIVIHSLTKYMSGTGTSIGGAIVDSGTFPWGDYPERFPLLNTPDESYHGVNFVKDVGAAAFIARARVAPLRNTGAAISPLNAFGIMQGMETLSLRMERHVQNAQAVAEYLRDHDKVAWVGINARSRRAIFHVAEHLPRAFEELRHDLLLVGIAGHVAGQLRNSRRAQVGVIVRRGVEGCPPAGRVCYGAVVKLVKPVLARRGAVEVSRTVAVCHHGRAHFVPCAGIQVRAFV